MFHRVSCLHWAIPPLPHAQSDLYTFRNLGKYLTVPQDSLSPLNRVQHMRTTSASIFLMSGKTSAWRGLVQANIPYTWRDSHTYMWTRKKQSYKPSYFTHTKKKIKKDQQESTIYLCWMINCTKLIFCSYISMQLNKFP